jgi:hypothetical protein
MRQQGFTPEEFDLESWSNLPLDPARKTQSKKMGNLKEGLCGFLKN